MSDGSSYPPQMTAGLDLGDKYSYLCLIDTQSGEVIEEVRPPEVGFRDHARRPRALERKIADLDGRIEEEVEACGTSLT